MFRSEHEIPTWETRQQSMYFTLLFVYSLFCPLSWSKPPLFYHCSFLCLTSKHCSPVNPALFFFFFFCLPLHLYPFLPVWPRLTSASLCRGVSTSADLKREPLGVEAGKRGQWPLGETDGSLCGPPQVRHFSSVQDKCVVLVLDYFDRDWFQNYFW